ncbi:MULTISPECIES: DNA-3-methyladenine glycosylase I [unclassified Marinobacterium]|uniref:DNA-3-methyladenine glycosylase I n=1 Tax=unclassified Marinobacterium TaxID=2644139 RepID=UPI0015698368|nr:DNA-3-methyladenine glycosylase 1 [Marinobacterium sp. xm-d-543]NRQ24436.1 DNA-3-methyladenine glycosylase 1 [Marinobacterium sp. xm-m-312]
MSQDADICGWARQSEIEHRYHDQEWGLLRTDDRTLFEFMVLESAQAGLSWRTVLNKREGYRRHYRNFEPERVAQFGEKEIEAMLADAGVIRNRAKIEASINNAKHFLAISTEFDGFANFLWSFMESRVIVNRPKTLADIPAETDLSKQIAKDLKRRGVRFFGSTIVYAYLQATGFVNDHLETCPAYQRCIDHL